MRRHAFRRRAVLFLTFASCLPYLNGLRNELVYDDRALIVENEAVRSLHPLPFLLGPSLSSERLEWYRPLTIYSFALQYRLHGSSPFGYHLVNLLLHLLCVLLLHAVGHQILKDERAAALAAGLFAVHPVHVEAVVPASGRADLLAALFVLAAWRASLSGGVRPSLPRAGAVTVSFFAALLCKESAIAGWPLILLSDLWRRWTSSRGGGEPFELRNRTFLHAALALAALLYFFLRATALGGWLLPSDHEFRILENPLAAELPLGVRWATSVWILLRYSSLLVAPLRLSADYSYNQIPLVASFTDPRAWIAFLALLAAGAAAFMLRRRSFSFLGLLFLASWLPVSNLGVPIGTLMAERLMYLPSAFFCLALGRWFSLGLGCPRMRRPLSFLSLAVLLAFSARTLVRNRDWRDQETLFATTVRTAPRSAKAHYNYATELLRAGRPEEARSELETALGIAPRFAEAHSALGTVFLGRNDLVRAEAEFRRALQQNPRLSSAWLNLGLSLFRSGQDEEARRVLQEALRFDPRRPIAWATLGAVEERRGEPSEALRLYRRAFELDPDFPGLASHLANLLEAAGHGEEAERVRRR